MQRVIEHSETRLLDDRGRPYFGLTFYALAKDGRYAGACAYEGTDFAVCDEKGHVDIEKVKPMLFDPEINTAYELGAKFSRGPIRASVAGRLALAAGPGSTMGADAAQQRIAAEIRLRSAGVVSIGAASLSRPTGLPGRVRDADRVGELCSLT